MTRYIILRDSDLRFAYGYATSDISEAINGNLYTFMLRGTDATLFSNWGEAHAVVLRLYEIYPDQHFSVVDVIQKEPEVS